MAASLWPWLAVAAMGALHGLNPASGWPAAAWQARTGDGLPLRRLLLPLALGHGASVVSVAAAVPLALQLGVDFDARWLQGVAAALLLALLLHHVLHRGGHAARTGTGLALWSFIVGTAHGAGWMLVPALVPLCGNDMPARELTASGSLLLGLAAVAVHLAALLATTAVLAVLARHGLHRWHGTFVQYDAHDEPPTVAPCHASRSSSRRSALRLPWLSRRAPPSRRTAA